jgi:hypothetical protein
MQFYACLQVRATTPGTSSRPHNRSSTVALKSRPTMTLGAFMLFVRDCDMFGTHCSSPPNFLLALSQVIIRNQRRFLPSVFVASAPELPPSSFPSDRKRLNLPGFYFLRSLCTVFHLCLLSASWLAFSVHAVETRSFRHFLGIFRNALEYQVECIMHIIFRVLSESGSASWTS